MCVLPKPHLTELQAQYLAANPCIDSDTHIIALPYVCNCSSCIAGVLLHLAYPEYSKLAIHFIKQLGLQCTHVQLSAQRQLKLTAAAGNLRGLVRQLSIDQFENEGRRVSMGTDSVQKPQRTPLFERHSSDPGVHKVKPLSTLHPVLDIFLCQVCGQVFCYLGTP